MAKSWEDLITDEKASEQVVSMAQYIHKLETQIRYIRDQRGDDKCRIDWYPLFAMLPEGYTPPEQDETVELELCKKYIASCHDPNIKYISPQRRIEELTLENQNLKLKIASMNAELEDWHNGAIGN